MFILGINAYHGDSSACIYRDGHLIAATEEERIRRVKHWAGLPSKAIQFCLNEADISLGDLDYVTVSRDPKAKFSEKVKYALGKRISIQSLINRGKNSFNITNLKKEIADDFGVNPKDLKFTVKFVEHHRSHMASAFLASPFEESALLSVDGMGDFSSIMRGVGRDTAIEIVDSVSYPHSLGMFYTAFTQYLGFPNYGDEYKVMGLSPYGKPIYKDKILNTIILPENNGLFKLNDNYFRHFKEGVNMSWEGGSPVLTDLFTDEFIDDFGPKRTKSESLEEHHMNIAASVQKVTEEIIFHMLEDLYNKTGLSNVCIAGGVAQNSVANGKVINSTKFERLFVPPAGHDAGTSIGSALYFYHTELKNPRSKYQPMPYTGAKFSNKEIEKILRDADLDYQVMDDEQLFEYVSSAIMDGSVVGWFQGRAEFGPRALGNRSILVDPRRKDAKELLNVKIKKRESFRPFAPSILIEHVADYFEEVDDVPFMEKVFNIKPSKYEEIPAVTHVNGTGRLQTVDKEVNSRYHALITSFYEKSKTPILLNTSFNENEPIVNTPKEALECYLRTNMDLLVMENVVVQRS